MVTGQPEADEAVMNQPGEIREDDVDDLLGRKIARIVDTGVLFVVGCDLSFVFVKFKNKEGFNGEKAGEVEKKTGEFTCPEHRRQAKSVRGIFQSFEKVTFFE